MKPHNRRLRTAATLTTLAVALLLTACASAPPTIVQGPVTAPPPQRPATIERVATGSLFPPGGASLFSGRQKPRNIGDTLKVDISESLKASSASKTGINRDSSFSSKGSGDAGQNNLLRSLINQDVSGAGKSNFKGDGSTSSDSSFQGQLAASVINVLPNGNLVVAGERSIAVGGEIQTLRFSGMVNPSDIKDGNIIASADVVNARLEILGKGDITDNTKRNWLQRMLNNTLSVW